MPGVFRPYTLTDVLGAIADQNGVQSVDTSTNGVGYFAETDETLSPVAGLLYRAAPEVDQSPEGVTAWSVAKQLGTVAGDWIFIYLFGTDVGSGVACPGFTVVQDNGPYGAFLYRLADGTEGGSFTITGLAGVAVTSVIVTIGGGQTTLDPPSVGTISTSGPSTSLAVSSISLANSGDWVLWFAGNEDGFTNVSYAIMPPTGFTPRGTNGAQLANPCVMVADNQSLPTGSTGAQTGTCSTPSFWSGVMVGLTPAPTVPALTDDAIGTVQAPAGWDGTEWNQFSWEVALQDYLGVFGDGSDGPATADGATGIPGMSRAGSVYTMTRDVFYTAFTINAGVTIQTAGYRIFCAGAVVNNGTITNAGNAGGATGTNGAQTSSGSLNNGKSGASGTTGVGAAGVNAGTSPGAGAAGAGGAGSSGAGGAAGTITGSGQTWVYRTAGDSAVSSVFTAIFNIGATPGGGSGAGDGTNKGGGGGSGGGPIQIVAFSVVNNGTINASGGPGGTPTTGNCGGGGGGGGGFVLIYTLSAWTPGTVNVAGGAAGNGVGTGSAGTAGGTGFVLNVVLV